MSPDTVAAFLSVIAAVASAVAAGMSYKLANAVEARAVADERRRLERDIDETARMIDVDAQRATSVCERVKALQNDWFNAAGAFHGSARTSELKRTEQTLSHLSDIREQTRGIAHITPGSFAGVDLDPRVSALREHLARVRGILHDALTERDELTAPDRGVQCRAARLS